MAKLIRLGTYSVTGKYFDADALRFMETRTLVMASSGGGKSWVLRKIIEELVGQCQVVVIDIEGEFLTLREKFDFVVAGKGGDVSADPRYADALCRRLLELNTDAICDLQELKQHDRVRFVRLFLESLMNLPKELWKPLAVVLDEAHLFAPEKGNAESLNAVIDVGSRGRKRGFFLIPATQRLSKLHKDVAAECQNKMIGLANLDIDRKRAAEELGFTEKAMVMELRDMAPGEFFAVGPAFGRGVQRVKIGPVKTRHPQPGSGRMKIHVPAPTAKVKAVLAKLADLPKEAEQEVKTVAGLKEQVEALKRQIRTTPTLKVEAPKVDRAAEEAAFKRGHSEGRAKQMEKVAHNVAMFKMAIQKALADFCDIELIKLEVFKAPVYKSDMPAKVPTGGTFDYKITHVYGEGGRGGVMSEEMKKLGPCERAILSVMALAPGKFFTKSQVAARSGYRKTSSGFSNALSRLNVLGYIERSGDTVRTRPGVDVSGFVTESPKSLEDWLPKLGACEREILKALMTSPQRVFTKEEVADMTTPKYSITSSGFNNSISSLNVLGLIQRHGKGGLSVNPELVD